MANKTELGILCALGVGLAGCASSPPPPPPAQPPIVAEVSSSPTGAAVALGGRNLGPAPVVVRVDRLADLVRVSAELHGAAAIEKRVRVIDPKRAQVSFRFDGEPSAMATRLGLTRVLIFDFSATATFDLNRSDLKPDLLPLLREQADVLNKFFAGLRVFVCGHTDATGTNTHNLELSVARAQSVADILVASGVGKDRLTIQGFGSDYPVGSNDTDDGRALNRRTELVLPQ